MVHIRRQHFSHGSHQTKILFAQFTSDYNKNYVSHKTKLFKHGSHQTQNKAMENHGSHQTQIIFLYSSHQTQIIIIIGNLQSIRLSFDNIYGSHPTKVIFCMVHIRHNKNSWCTSDKILISGSHQTSDKAFSKWFPSDNNFCLLYSHQTKIFSEWFIAH